MKNLELKRRKRERTTKGNFNKNIKSQGEEQDIRNKDDETNTPPLPLLLPQTATKPESRRGGLK